MATGVWFVRQHFWFLDILVGSIHLRSLCVLVLLALAPAVLVPGLVISGLPYRFLLEALLVGQASVLCVLEEKLFAPSHEELAGEVMYPAFLVVATTVAGVVASRRLASDGLLASATSWLLHSLYLSKLTMLVLPEAYLVLPVSLLVLATTAPLFLYNAEVNISSSSRGETFPLSLEDASPPLFSLPQTYHMRTQD